jgi:hypothetical protein
MQLKSLKNPHVNFIKKKQGDLFDVDEIENNIFDFNEGDDF